MASSLERDARRLHGAFAGLLRHVQFRDRDRVCCHGISVTQCHALNELDENGPFTMGQLAERLLLEISTTTRAVDGLVRRRLVRRLDDPRDRRVRHVRITEAGRSLLTRIRGESISAHKRALAEVSPANRSEVISAIERLLAAYVKCRKPGCTKPERS